MMAHDKRSQLHRVEAELLKAIASRDFELSYEDLKGGFLVKTLRVSLTELAAHKKLRGSSLQAGR